MIQVKTVNTPPPSKIYDRAKEKWGVNFEEGVVFTYGDTIHAFKPISYDLTIHEMVHVRQQNEIGKDEWWDMYFKNENFRLLQELEAYQEQYKSVVENVKDRNEQARALFAFATTLSGDMYGNIITHSEAMIKIRNK